MRKFLLVSVSLAGLGLAVQAAQAADIVAPEPVATFTGFHIGVGGGAGYNFYDADSEADLFAVDPEDGDILGLIVGDIIKGDDLGAWYGFGTIEIGFDYQFPDSPFVIGVLGNYDFNGDSEADAEHSIFIGGPAGAAINSKIEAELEDSWFLGGRLGFVFNDDTLVYGLGGYTWVDGKVKADHELDLGGPEFAGVHINDKDNVDGFTLGAGIEHLITENLSLKVEYRHDFLDDLNASETTIFEDAGPGGTDLAVVQDAKVDFSRDTIRAVLSWRFNPGW